MAGDTPGGRFGASAGTTSAGGITDLGAAGEAFMDELARAAIGGKGTVGSSADVDGSVAVAGTAVTHGTNLNVGGVEISVTVDEEIGCSVPVEAGTVVVAAGFEDFGSVEEALLTEAIAAGRAALGGFGEGFEAEAVEGAEEVATEADVVDPAVAEDVAGADDVSESDI